MYLLDTNVISELRKTETQGVDDNLLKWVRRVSTGQLFLSVISILEIEKGILLVERRDVNQAGILRSWLDNRVIPTFINRIIPVDVSIAKQCAHLHIPDPRPERDAIIAATALVHKMTIVTRNLKDFQNMGLTIINPWEEKNSSS